MVHRLLNNYLNDKNDVSLEKIENLCKHTSEQEIKATRAERESIKYMQAKFMNERVGMTFEGIISGVTNFGILLRLQIQLVKVL